MLDPVKIHDLRWWDLLENDEINWKLADQVFISQVFKNLHESRHFRIIHINMDDWDSLKKDLVTKLPNGYTLQDNCDFENNVVFVKIVSVACQKIASGLCMLIYESFQRESKTRSEREVNLIFEPATRYKMSGKSTYYFHDGGITTTERIEKGQLPSILIEVGIFKEDISFTNKCKMWFNVGDYLHRESNDEYPHLSRKPNVCIGINLFKFGTSLIGLNIHYFVLSRNGGGDIVKEFERSIRIYREDINIDTRGVELRIPYSDLYENTKGMNFESRSRHRPRSEVGSRYLNEECLLITTEQLKNYYKMIESTINL